MGVGEEACDPTEDYNCEWLPPCGASWLAGGPYDTWQTTDSLHAFLTKVLHFPEIRYEEVPHVNEPNDPEALDKRWIKFLTEQGSTIKPGDVVFYWQKANQASAAYHWTHAALVVGWGPQTYYPKGGPSIPPVPEPAVPGIAQWSPCIGPRKPLIVEHSGALWSQAPDNKQPHSIDNTNSPAERITIVRANGYPWVPFHPWLPVPIPDNRW